MQQRPVGVTSMRERLSGDYYDSLQTGSRVDRVAERNLFCLYILQSDRYGENEEPCSIHSQQMGDNRLLLVLTASTISSLRRNMSCHSGHNKRWRSAALPHTRWRLAVELDHEHLQRRPLTITRT